MFDFQDIDKTKLGVVGGKGAPLGELARVDGIQVPDGFCVTTVAIQRIIAETPTIHELLEQLARLQVDDRDKIAELYWEMRRIIAANTMPDDIRAEIARHPG